MDGDYGLTVVKTDGGEVSGKYSYFSALARLEHASAQTTFCHATMTDPLGDISASEYAIDCPHLKALTGGR